MNKIIIIFLLVFCSCTSAKKLTEKKTKTDTTTTSTEVGTVTSTRAGDTLTVLVPSIIYKDTTITRRGKTTTLIQNYDKDGNLQVDCISDDIKEFKEYIIDLVEEKEEEIDESSKEVERGWQPIFIAYGFISFIRIDFTVLSFLSKYLLINPEPQPISIVFLKGRRFSRERRSSNEIERA